MNSVATTPIDTGTERKSQSRINSKHNESDAEVYNRSDYYTEDENILSDVGTHPFAPPSFDNPLLSSSFMVNSQRSRFETLSIGAEVKSLQKSGYIRRAEEGNKRTQKIKEQRCGQCRV